MNELMFSLNIIMPIFILLMLGYFLGKLKFFSQGFLKDANNFVFKILLPFSLFTNVFTSNIIEMFRLDLVLIAVIGVIVIFLVLLVIIPLFIKDKKKIGVMIQGIFRSNFVLFGLPFATSMYGEVGGMVAGVVAAFYVPVINILSSLVLFIYSDAEDKSLGKCFLGVITNPLVIGGFSGIIFALIRCSLNIEVSQMPEFIVSTLRTIGSSATPVAFIILGADLKFHSMFRHIKYVLVGCVGRLVIIPAIGILISYFLFDIKGLGLAILITVFATPNAVSSYAMARNYKADYELAGELVASSTIISMATMFVFVLVTKSLGMI